MSTIENEIKDVQQLVLNELIQRNGLSSTIANSSITTLKLADGAVTSDKLASDVTFAPTSGSINTSQLANGAINSDKLATDAVIEAKIADDAVTTNKILDGAVTTAKLASTVSLNIADDAITTAKIADDAITTAQILDGAVSADKLGSDVDLGQVTDGAVDNNKLAPNAVTASKIGASEVGTLAVADTAITTDKIEDGAINEAKLSQAYLPIAGGSLTGNLGIGTTTAPADELHIKGTTPVIRVEDTGGGYATLDANDGTLVISADVTSNKDDSFIGLNVDGAEAMRIDSSGNLLVSGTNTTPNTNSAGSTADNEMALRNDGLALFSAYKSTASDGVVMDINRTSTDGGILGFRKDGSTVGTIGVTSGGSSSGLYIGDGDVGLELDDANNAIYPYNTTTLLSSDNVIDLGDSNKRFVDIYATNGTIQTSDANDKQDIEELSEAEQRVAVAAKGLLRKFRWKSAVEEKGEEARIHFGIIAQDLQAAFEAEGLDAGRYAMFISSTWWEKERVVPAVEEETDEEGNITTEAQESYTTVDTWNTEEEADEGATSKTRLGVRYSELLAFIISAI